MLSKDHVVIFLTSLIVSGGVMVLTFSTDCTGQYGLKEQVREQTGNNLFEFRDIRVDKMRESTESGALAKVTPARYEFLWNRISVNYASSPIWADGVSIKYFVLMEDRNRIQDKTMLTGEVIYDCIPRGFIHYGFVFIHPRTIERYGKPSRIMCEIWYEGVRVARHFWPKETRDEWWVRYKPLEGNLRVKYFTPYVLDTDLKEENINIKSIIN